jgi:hypothetical protein
VLIGAIAVYNWIVAPHRNYLLAAQRYESAAGSLAKKSQVVSNNVAMKRKALEELQAKFKQVRGRLFNPVEAGRFFSNIQNKSEEVNCIIRSLTFSPGSSASSADRSEANSYITAQRATLSVLGGYGNIVALMNKLQDCSKQVCIDSVRINSDNKNSGYLECDMTITIYVIRGKEEHRHD